MESGKCHDELIEFDTFDWDGLIAQENITYVIDACEISMYSALPIKLYKASMTLSLPIENSLTLKKLHLVKSIYSEHKIEPSILLSENKDGYEFIHSNIDNRDILLNCTISADCDDRCTTSSENDFKIVATYDSVKLLAKHECKINIIRTICIEFNHKNYDCLELIARGKKIQYCHQI
jgi:hypothetical protein